MLGAACLQHELMMPAMQIGASRGGRQKDRSTVTQMQSPQRVLYAAKDLAQEGGAGVTTPLGQSETAFPAQDDRSRPDPDEANGRDRSARRQAAPCRLTRRLNDSVRLGPR